MFLHTYEPESILFRIGPITIYWYGLLIAIGIGVAWLVISYLVKNLKSPDRPKILKHIENVAVWGIIIGLIGARLYHVLSELPYYIEHPLQIFMLWRGGIGIFGALAGALVVLIIYCRRHALSFLCIADIFAPGIIIAQAIGRWGNYFNNELFGLPTTLPWGIPISALYRPDEFVSYEYFHPTFLYESLWNIFVFVILFLLFKKIYQYQVLIGERLRGVHYTGLVFALYLILYSLGRFLIEFIRIDPQPVILGLRLAQITALAVFVIGWGIVIKLQITNPPPSPRLRRAGQIPNKSKIKMTKIPKRFEF